MNGSRRFSARSAARKSVMLSRARTIEINDDDRDETGRRPVEEEAIC